MPPDQDELLTRLRSGDEAAFAIVLREWSPGMLRVAHGYVSTAASAEEVVQDTWLAVVVGLADFEGRSSLRTWVFRILVNRAKTRGVRESRVLPLPALEGPDGSGLGVDGSLLVAGGRRAREAAAAGAPPARVPSPESVVLARELRAVLDHALDTLPGRQRVVITLRDVQGVSVDEVCSLLGITPENQRVLLHRARSKVRAALEDYYRTAVIV